MDKNLKAAEQSVSPEVLKAVEVLMAQPQVKRVLEFFQSDNERTTKDQIDVTAVAAPTFQEETRGEYYKQKLLEAGLKNISVDRTGNVFGERPGTGNGPKLVVSAHLDTVFPEGTDTAAKIVDGKVYAPGISDDGRGLAVLLTLLRGLEEAHAETVGDLIFVATVGEEGLGDLRGVKGLFQDRSDIDGFISIEPGNPERIIYLATGSHRYNVTYKGPGGHSFGNFGIPSAIHALGRAIAKLSDIRTPENPKTTFNVGTITGGTSVNTIAAEASMLVDLRSTSQEELLKVEEQVLDMLKQAADEENARWNSDSIEVEIQLVGDRPAGSQPKESIIVQTALAASEALGFQPVLDEPSSTDSNVPIGLGIPAVTLGGGGNHGGVHTLEEYFDPTDAFYGPQKILLTVLALAGLKDIQEPLLEKRNKLVK